MHEADKLAEADYFFRQMVALEGDRWAHKYNFSAFLTSARSVLQFALEEAKRKKGGQGWYDGQTRSEPVVQFFKDRRDLNIHAEPASPNEEIAIQLNLAVNISMGVSASLIREGQVVPEELVRTLPSSQEAPPPPVFTCEDKVVYRLVEWSGLEDLNTLCRMYLAELKRIVADGQTKG